MRALAFLFVLASCAGRLVPPGITGNEAFVSISNVWNEGEALPYATRHCAQFGKIARLKDIRGNTAIFDCI